MGSSTAPLSTEEAKSRAGKLYERHFGSWASLVFLGKLKEVAAEPFASLPWSIPLHRPSERSALKDLEGTRRWADDWRVLPLPPDTQLEWEERNWPTIGTQCLPTRLLAQTPAAVASLAGRLKSWQLACLRIAQLADVLRGSYGQNAIEDSALDIANATKRSMRSLCSMRDADWNRTLDVLAWLAEHPDEPRFIRELPIFGIDTKWAERHWSTIRPIYELASGRRYQFKQLPPLVRIRFLGTGLAPSELADLALPIVQLANLEKQRALTVPKRVIVCENLTTMLALPPLKDTLAVHGGGYRVGELKDVPWLSETELYYWGDLDTHGFAILSLFRSHFPSARSILMDRGTLLRHSSLCVTEEKPNAGRFECLTAEEQATLETLRGQSQQSDWGDFPTIDFSRHALRLEQERVSWPWALEQLSQQWGMKGD
ncbi:Wadjet anti-phage system protein JetD domain-containing protein [uncultured Adlercreutzia sp.]|uniref:Wadjet anti-phage system protein JetD domain-containing protein n=1 Tax=uncultured Adlercreutzia sp. TaxID=875803 RepID=UPI0025E1A4A3|nr:Wadjet anti-phage system protein JetD domain-containing protein [uncultured Adlercreutzia sp.]